MSPVHGDVEGVGERLLQVLGVPLALLAVGELLRVVTGVPVASGDTYWLGVGEGVMERVASAAAAATPLTRRTTRLYSSQMYTLPSCSARPVGLFSPALVAGPPSPKLPLVPPATRTRWFEPGVSASTATPPTLKYTRPAASTARPCAEGSSSARLLASVVMTPVAAVIMRMRWLLESIKKTLSAASIAIWEGPFSVAFVAKPPSPRSPAPTRPATVVMLPDAADTLRMRPLEYSAMYTSPPTDTATPYGSDKRELVAGRPSGPKPPVPVPATVVMMPVSADTLRTR